MSTRYTWRLNRLLAEPGDDGPGSAAAAAALDERVAQAQRLAARAVELAQIGERFLTTPEGVIRFRDGRIERVS